MQDLKKFLIASFPNAQIYLFGSRAREEASENSDIDIAIQSIQPIREKLTQARFEIEESQLPYKVDLIDLSFAPYLRSVIEKEGILWHS